MNMHAKPQMTAAEQALVAAYTERLAALPGDAAVMRKRDDAVETIKDGLPTRRVEAWHYTDLRRLLTSVPDFDPAAKAEALTPLVAGSTVVTIRNGVASTEKLAAPEGTTIVALSQKLADGSFAPALELRAADDAVGAVNTAFVADGVFVDVAADAKVETPIELQNVQAGGQVHVRLPVRVAGGASVTIVERQTGAARALVSSVSHLTVGEGAEVIWVIVQDQADTATYLGQFNAEIGKGAKLTVFFMNAGARLVRQEVRVKAAGDDCEFTLRGINLLSGETHCDVTMVLDHDGHGASSTEVVSNVILDRAHGVFQGQIKVAQKAQKTDAKMACNTLLLSDDAEFSVKPELEIFADDVACGHGATVTDIDQNHLFYLMARGVPEKEARGLLVKAFLAEVIETLDNEPLVEALEERLDGWFATHG